MKLNKKFYLFVLFLTFLSSFSLNFVGANSKDLSDGPIKNSADFPILKSVLLKFNKTVEDELTKSISDFFALEGSIQVELDLESNLKGRAKLFLDSRFFKRKIVKGAYLENKQEIVQIRDFLAEILAEFYIVKKFIEQSNNLASLLDSFAKLIFVTEKLFIKVQLSQEKFSRNLFNTKSSLEDLKIVIAQQEQAFVKLNSSLKDCINYKEPSFWLRNSMKLYLTGVISLATLVTLICIGHDGRTNLWDSIKGVGCYFGLFISNGYDSFLKTFGFRSIEENIFAQDKFVVAQSCREQGKQILDLVSNCPFNSRNAYDLRDAKLWIEAEKMRVTDCDHDIYEGEQFQRILEQFRRLHAEFGVRKDEFIIAVDRAKNFDVTQHLSTMMKPYLVDDPACRAWFSTQGVISRLAGKFISDHAARLGADTLRPINELSDKTRDFIANILGQGDILTGKVSDRVVRYAELWIAGLLFDISDFWQALSVGANKVDSIFNAINTMVFLSFFAGIIIASYKIYEKNKSDKTKEIDIVIHKISLLLNKAKIDNSIEQLSIKDKGYLSYFIYLIEKDFYALNKQEQRKIALLILALKDEALNLSQKLRACEFSFA